MRTLEKPCDMDDKSKETEEALIECPACHYTVPARNMTTVFGRQLCLSCAGAWFAEDEDDD